MRVVDTYFHKWLKIPLVIGFLIYTVFNYIMGNHFCVKFLSDFLISKSITLNFLRNLARFRVRVGLLLESTRNKVFTVQKEVPSAGIYFIDDMHFR